MAISISTINLIQTSNSMNIRKKCLQKKRDYSMHSIHLSRARVGQYAFAPRRPPGGNCIVRNFTINMGRKYFDHVYKGSACTTDPDCV